MDPDGGQEGYAEEEEETHDGNISCPQAGETTGEEMEINGTN